jgi:hypothetical protein
MTPKHFASKDPMGSIFSKYEYELVARNIMIILSRTKDEWRELSWDEYKEERLKDGNFSDSECSYFKQVLPYTLNLEVAQQFSKSWIINK